MKNNIDTTVQFSGLKPGRYEYAYELGKDFFSGFENEKILDGNVRFIVKLDKKDRLLMFDFSFLGTVKTECDRCLGEMEVPVEGEDHLCVKFSDTETSDAEDVVFLPEKAWKINLAQWMYEFVLVAMPMQCVHPDDDEGNSTCNPEMLEYISGQVDAGAEEWEDDDHESDEDTETPSTGEVDPRWAKLLDLK